MARLRPSPAVALVAAFFAVYFFWGSSYVGIAFAIATVPPMIMSAARYFLAGVVLYSVCRITGAPRPALRDWGKCSLLGFLLIFCGNAGSTWAVKHIPSGLAALLVATEPLWLVLLAWMMGCGERPRRRVLVGLALGFAGTVTLIGSPGAFGFGAIQVVAMAVTVLGAFFWALGSVFAIRIKTSASPFMASAMMLLCGGAIFAIASAASGEAGAMRLSAVSPASLAAIGYLAVFCSIIPLSAYVWLIRRCCPHRVATHAFVNPVVAVFLGWLLVGETVTERTLAAGIAIVLGVVLLVWRKAPQPAIKVVKVVEEQAPIPEPALQAS